jgi:hypothetical protein
MSKKNINGNIELTNLKEKNLMPNPVFLVIGISKNYENNIKRSIYNNQSYYFLDELNPKKNSLSEEGRFIHCNFNNIEDLQKISRDFKETFNIVFFDKTVFKFFDKLQNIIFLLNIVKKGGYIIIPDYSFFSYIPIGMSNINYSILNEIKKQNIRKTQKIIKRDKILNDLKELKLNVKTLNITKIKEEIIQSKNVYNNTNNNNNQYGFVIIK